MRKIIYLFCLFSTLAALGHPPLPVAQDNRSYALGCVGYYDQLLKDQSSIEHINQSRPKIYFYTDFGGGLNGESPLIDRQTSGELASSAWKATLQQELYVNDSAAPLDPFQAALHLAKRFPYQSPSEDLCKIDTIVVHVIDPGVGNQDNGKHPQPRAIVLRKDGIVFIGPDNGTLTFACPSGSIAAIWEINQTALQHYSGVDTKSGGTFHGRDLFGEAAIRIASATLSIDDIGCRYATQDLLNRFPAKDPLCLGQISPIKFEAVKTERSLVDFDPTKRGLFETAFLLGVTQSSLYSDNQPLALTRSKKIFIVTPVSEDPSEIIGIVNHRTGNVFIGPNNGIGTTFFLNFAPCDVEFFQLSKPLLEEIENRFNNEAVYALLQKQPCLQRPPIRLSFKGDEEDVLRDQEGRPTKVEATIWIDPYGNIKTTVKGSLLDEVKACKGKTRVVLNGIERPAIFADTFSQVKEGELFIYNGSTGAFGPNPHRSERFVEVTANGQFGKFGVDFFEQNGVKPHSGQTISLYFEYQT